MQLKTVSSLTSPGGRICPKVGQIRDRKLEAIRSMHRQIWWLWPSAIHQIRECRPTDAVSPELSL